MNYIHVPDLTQLFSDCAEDLQTLRQNSLLDEDKFITFSTDRSIAAQGVIRGDPGIFHRRGLLKNDGLDYKGEPTFHPFRIYPLHKLLNACKLTDERFSLLQQDRDLWIMQAEILDQPYDAKIESASQETNGVCDLAVLLEPIYWPRIISKVLWHGEYDENNCERKRETYYSKLIDIVKSLDPDIWKGVHERLRLDAAKLDRNAELYLLLRLSNWERRERLIGKISGALWLRHMAEVIRRAFEEAHSVKWFEEDRAFETWFAGDRTFAYGMERPLDDENKAGPYLAWNYSLLTGSVVRWYVEGKTEYYAILEIIPEPIRAGIELIDLRGNLATGKGNIAMTLADGLKADKVAKRFSVLSFDTDVPENVRSVRQQLLQGNIVGYIAAHSPDFEFSNFTVQELVEVAARIADSNDVSGDAIRQVDWADITSGRNFEERYKQLLVAQAPNLKGEEWGRELARYADENPNRSDTGEERPFWNEIRTALQGRIVRYDYHQAHITFDPETFEQIDINPEGVTVNEEP